MELEFHLKSSTGRSYSNKNNTEAICEWRLNCGKYVMNRTDLQLVCYSIVCNQYIASMYYPYKHFVSFSLDRIKIDTLISVIVVSPTTWEAHHSPRASPSGCGELPRSLVTRPRAVVSFPGRWWHHNDLNLGINSYIHDRSEIITKACI